MKKKENLKKLSTEEKLVSTNRRRILYSLVTGLIFFSTLDAQIPINGFCRYSEFTTKSKSTNIFSVDFNSDGYRDLLIYNQNNNKYSTLSGDAKSFYKLSTEKFLSFTISDIHSFGKETTSKRFLLVSRKSKQALLGSISNRGSLSVSGKIKINGYPSTVDVGDVDGDGKPEGLISGAATNGLYIISEKNKKLKETQIQPNKIFSTACFIDLNYDSFVDIAALDLLSNSIILFYNDGSGNFTESRSIGLNDESKDLKPADINSDGFTDLILVKKNRFEIFLGDSVSSFQKKSVLDTPESPDKYTVLDFNGDGYNDIAFINFKSGSLYISFAKNGNSFYDPILYMRKDSLTDLTAFIDRTGKKLAVIDTDGKVFIINSIGIDQNTFSITLGQKPTAIKTFDLMKDKFKDLCFIDEREKSLKLLVSERRNLCRTYYNIPLSSNLSEVLVDDSRDIIKTFICYSRGERVIDLIRLNFDNQEQYKKTFYTDGEIEDLKFISDRLRDRIFIYALIKKGRELQLQTIEIRDFHNSSSNTVSIESKFDGAWISFGVFKDIFIISISNKIELFKTIVDKKIVGRNLLLTFNLYPRDKLFYDMIFIDKIVNKAKPDVLGITINRNSFLYIFAADGFKKYKLKKTFNSQFYFMYNFTEEDNELTIYNYDNSRGIIHSSVFKDLNKPPVEKDLFESKQINNYFVANFISKKTFLIYSDNLQNTITFKKI